MYLCAGDVGGGCGRMKGTVAEAGMIAGKVVELEAKEKVRPGWSQCRY